MKILKNEDLGKLIARLAVAGLLLFHGFGKLLHGVSFIEQSLMGVGLPSFFAYGTHIGVLIAPILLIIGLKVRLSALVIAFTMFIAIVLVRINDTFSFTQHGAWGIESPMFYLLSSLAIAFLGAGKYSIEKAKTK